MLLFAPRCAFSSPSLCSFAVFCCLNVFHSICLPNFKPLVLHHLKIEMAILCFHIHPPLTPASSMVLALLCFSRLFCSPSFYIRLPCICLLLSFALESETGSHLAAGQSQIHQRSSLLFNSCSPHFLFRLSFLFTFLLQVVFLSFPISALSSSPKSDWPCLSRPQHRRVICTYSFSITLYDLKASGQAWSVS